MKYIDRKGNITIEENGQDKFLRHLYNDWGGRLCLKIIIQPFVTRLGGWFLNTRLSARMISLPAGLKRGSGLWQRMTA